MSSSPYRPPMRICMAYIIDVAVDYDDDVDVVSTALPRDDGHGEGGGMVARASQDGRDDNEHK